MLIDVQLTREPLESLPPSPNPDPAGAGAWVEFRGVVRGEEDNQPIEALVYEAYDSMAVSEMRRLLNELGARHRCLAASVVHRIGRIAVGEAAIHLRVAGRHRAEGFLLASQFMDRLKQDVPIWKVAALPCAAKEPAGTP